MNCQMFSTGFNSGERDDVFGHFEFASGVSSGPVHKQHRTSTGCDGPTDFLEMFFHDIPIGVSPYCFIRRLKTKEILRKIEGLPGLPKNLIVRF